MLHGDAQACEVGYDKEAPAPRGCPQTPPSHQRLGRKISDPTTAHRGEVGSRGRTPEDLGEIADIRQGMPKAQAARAFARRLSSPSSPLVSVLMILGAAAYYQDTAPVAQEKDRLLATEERPELRRRAITPSGGGAARESACGPERAAGQLGELVWPYHR